MKDKRCKDCKFFSDLFIYNDDYGRCCKNERNVYRMSFVCEDFRTEKKRCKELGWI